MKNSLYNIALSIAILCGYGTFFSEYCLAQTGDMSKQQMDQITFTLNVYMYIIGIFGILLVVISVIATLVPILQAGHARKNEQKLLDQVNQAERRALNADRRAEEVHQKLLDGLEKSTTTVELVNATLNLAKAESERTAAASKKRIDRELSSLDNRFEKFHI